MVIKYKWTPFQLLALVAVTLAVCDVVTISQMKGDPGLGGLSPIVYLGFGLGVFILDVIMQNILRKSPNAFYISQVVLCLIFVVWLYSVGEF